jgi:Flp pilus assembly CpaE family ATPase
MSDSIAICLPGDPREAELVSSLARSSHRLHVARRCVDVADLMAVCESGVVGAVVVGGRLLRLDREVVARIQVCGVGVVAIPVDRNDAVHLRELGVAHLADPGASLDEVAGLIRAAQRGGTAAPHAYSAPGTPTSVRARPRRGPEDLPAVKANAPAGPSQVPASVEQQRSAPSFDDGGDVGVDDLVNDAQSRRPSEVVAVWGPVGAPGRSSLALIAAEEAARAGRSTRLIDADTYGASLDQLLGLLGDEVPGIAAAARAAHHGRLDAATLDRLLRRITERWDVLTGLARADRWPELRPAAVETVLDLLARRPGLLIADIGFCVEHDEELAFDTLAPRRNAVALSVLHRADHVVAVAECNPVGVRRLVHGLDALAEVVAPSAQVRVVLNRTPPRGAGAHAQDVAALLAEHGHRVPVHPVVDDARAFAAWRSRAGTFFEAAPRSPVRAQVRNVLEAAGLAASDSVAHRLRGRRRAA